MIEPELLTFFKIVELDFSIKSGTEIKSFLFGIGEGPE
jgi:hypothetical protein